MLNTLVKYVVVLRSGTWLDMLPSAKEAKELSEWVIQSRVEMWVYSHDKGEGHGGPSHRIPLTDYVEHLPGEARNNEA